MAATADRTQGLGARQLADLGRASSAPVARGMGTGLSVPSAQLLGRGAQGRSFAGEWEGAAAAALGADALLGEKTDRGGGTRASGPAQPSPDHGERAARRRAVERGKGGRAHLGEAQRVAAHASSATRMATAAALRAGRGSDGGDGEAESEVEARRGGGGREIAQESRVVRFWRRRGRKKLRRAVRGRCTVESAPWRAGPAEQWRRRALGVHARSRGPARGKGEAGALARSWAEQWTRAGPRGWRGAGSWAASRRPKKGGGGAGPSGGEEGGEGGRGGPAEWAREGEGADFLSLFLSPFPIISV
jgi:hypothetical protein